MGVFAVKLLQKGYLKVGMRFEGPYDDAFCCSCSYLFYQFLSDPNGMIMMPSSRRYA